MKGTSAAVMLILALCAWAQPPLTIPDGTSIHVRLKQDLSSQKVHNGDTIEFTVAEPVIVNGVTVVAEGATATATVVNAKSAGHWGREGHLAWSMKAVDAVDGTTVPLRWIKEVPVGGEGAKGMSTAEFAGLAVATSPIILYYSPLIIASIPFGAAIKGKPEIIPAGEHYLVFVNGDTRVAGGGDQ